MWLDSWHFNSVKSQLFPILLKVDLPQALCESRRAKNGVAAFARVLALHLPHR